MDSVTTRVKAGLERVDRGFDDRLPDVRRRSATLIGAAVPGSQGAVRLWAPNRWRLWFSNMRGAPGLLLMLGLFFVVLPAFGLMLAAGSSVLVLLASAAVPLLLYLAVTLPAVLRPCYITTDAAGFAITTWSQNRSLSWSEIQFLERAVCDIYVVTGFPRRHEEAPNRMSINLAGYSGQDRQTILALFAEKADLHRHLHSPDLWVCSEVKLAGGRSREHASPFER